MSRKALVDEVSLTYFLCSNAVEPVLRQQEKGKEKRREKSTTDRQRRASVAVPEQPPAEQEDPDEPRRSGRELRLSVKRRESTNPPAKSSTSKPRRTSLHSARRRTSAHSRFLATKKAQFDGVELPALRPKENGVEGVRRALEPVNQRATRSFAQMDADADDSMEVD